MGSYRICHVWSSFYRRSVRFELLMSYKRLALVLAIVAVVGFALFKVNPSTFAPAPKCLFRFITGLSCPACGIQRFIHSLLTGHPLQAIRYNYYLIYAIPYTLLFVVAWLLKNGAIKQRLTSVIESKYAVWTYISTFLIWLVIRNILNI